MISFWCFNGVFLFFLSSWAASPFQVRFSFGTICGLGGFTPRDSSHCISQQCFIYSFFFFPFVQSVFSETSQFSLKTMYSLQNIRIQLHHQFSFWGGGVHPSLPAVIFLSVHKLNCSLKGFLAFQKFKKIEKFPVSNKFNIILYFPCNKCQCAHRSLSIETGL